MNSWSNENRRKFEGNKAAFKKGMPGIACQLCWICRRAMAYWKTLEKSDEESCMVDDLPISLSELCSQYFKLKCGLTSHLQVQTFACESDRDGKIKECEVGGILFYLHYRSAVNSEKDNKP